MHSVERVIAQDEGASVLCVRCEAERDGNPALSKSLRCAGACKKEKELRAFAPAVVRELLAQRWHRWKGKYSCQACEYPICAMCGAEDPGKQPSLLMYPPCASEYHEGIYVCATHRYPPCPSCGTPWPCREDGKGRVEYDVFHRPEWSCSACLEKRTELVRCMDCKQQKNVDEFAPYFTDCWKNVQNWRCLDCQYPVCARCGTRRSETLAPTRYEEAYQCERCRQTHGCGECGKQKPREAYDSTHLSHHLHHDRPLRCEDCQSKRDKQTYKCHRCDGRYFPPEHFDKRDLNKLQQGRKAKETLMCRK